MKGRRSLGARETGRGTEGPGRGQRARTMPLLGSRWEGAWRYGGQGPVRKLASIVACSSQSSPSSCWPSSQATAPSSRCTHAPQAALASSPDAAPPPARGPAHLPSCQPEQRSCSGTPARAESMCLPAGGTSRARREAALGGVGNRGIRGGVSCGRASRRLGGQRDAPQPRHEASPHESQVVRMHMVMAYRGFGWVRGSVLVGAGLQPEPGGGRCRARRQAGDRAAGQPGQAVAMPSSRKDGSAPGKAGRGSVAEKGR